MMLNKLFMLTQTTTAANPKPAADVIEQQVEKASGFVADLGESIKAAVPSLIIALIMLIIGMIVSKIITRITGKALSRSNVDKAAKNFLVSLVKILLYVVVIIMVLSFLSVPMTSILTILGAAGLAVSLALQNCLSNLCGGFIILFSKPFASGDIIETDGSVGTVSTIGILYTKIMTFDGKTVFIPNGKVSEAKIINYTETPTRRIDLAFCISYESDTDRARAAILEVIAGEKLILKEPAPIVRIGEYKENSVSVDTLVWVNNGDYFTARYDLLEKVKKAFAENGIVIPYSQLDVHIRDKKEGQ